MSDSGETRMHRKRLYVSFIAGSESIDTSERIKSFIQYSRSDNCTDNDAVHQRIYARHVAVRTQSGRSRDIETLFVILSS